MIILFLSAIIGVFSLQFFVLNYSIQGINRAVINTPIELMYKSVTFQEESPTFQIDKFESLLLDYYQSILPRYTKSYEIDFYFYVSGDESMCLENNCDGVEITINCKLNISYDYHRVMYYQMVEVNNG